MVWWSRCGGGSVVVGLVVVLSDLWCDGFWKRKISKRERYGSGCGNTGGGGVVVGVGVVWSDWWWFFRKEKNKRERSGGGCGDTGGVGALNTHWRVGVEVAKVVAELPRSKNSVLIWGFICSVSMRKKTHLFKPPI